jgi:hypothetical protein
MTQDIGTVGPSYKILGCNLMPAELVIGHDSFDWSVRIKTTGAVEVNPSVQLDDAALAFWRAVERTGFVRRAEA